jgi:citronellyl-CoA dehydrogenase
LLFTDEHHQFRTVVRSFIENEINPRVDEWEENKWIPLHEVFSQMAELGILGLEYDLAFGGQGADHGFSVILAEEMGRAAHGAIGMATGVQVDMATPSLHQYGSTKLKDQYLRPALDGRMVAGVAVTEPDAGSDVSGVRTKAYKDGSEWVINGSKMFITNSLQADWLCTLVRTSDEGGFRGMSQILIPTATEGFSVTNIDKLGMHASDTGLISFDDVRVPIANTIGVEGRGFQQQMEQFVTERMWANYAAVGTCELALSRTKDYLLERKVFGKPLMANQYIQYQLADLAAEVDMLKEYNYVIAGKRIAGEDITRQATIAKLKSARLQRKVADWCLQFHGGSGYMAENWTSRLFRDSRLGSIGGGADEVMLQVLARIEGYWA